MSESKEFNFIKSVMIGLDIIGRASHPKTNEDIQVLTFIAVGQYDEYLKCVAAHTQRLEITQVSELERPEILIHMNRLKDHFKQIIQHIFEKSFEDVPKYSRKDQDAILAKFRQSNKPHEMGTVAEIATKYGISKSEVRRMKAAGTLESLQLTDSLNKELT